MTDYKPQPGHRVRVVFEGVVTDGPGMYDEYRVSEDGKPHTDRVSWAWVRPSHMERLPDPEPDWRPGDVVRAADGQVYTCESPAHSGENRPWRLVGLDTLRDPWYRADELPRPLVPLVRDGKPWGEQ